MVSNLVNGDADMITANLDICCQRTNVIDYAWTLSATSLGFGIKSKHRRVIHKSGLQKWGRGVHEMLTLLNEFGKFH